MLFYTFQTIMWIMHAGSMELDLCMYIIQVINTYLTTIWTELSKYIHTWISQNKLSIGFLYMSNTFMLSFDRSPHNNSTSKQLAYGDAIAQKSYQSIAQARKMTFASHYHNRVKGTCKRVGILMTCLNTYRCNTDTIMHMYTSMYFCTSR